MFVFQLQSFKRRHLNVDTYLTNKCTCFRTHRKLTNVLDDKQSHLANWALHIFLLG